MRGYHIIPSLLIAMVGPALGQLPPGYTSVVNQAYVTNATGDQRLDIYFNPTSTPAPPLVIYIHGGGWNSGGRGNPAAWSLWTQGAPFQIASIDYTLTTNAPHPAQIRDVKSAIRWLRAHADLYNFDANRVGLVGPSAGGHLACLAGTSGGVTNFGGTEHAEQSDVVQAVFAAAPPTDLTLYSASSPGDEITLLLGDLLQNNPPTLPSANPINFVSPDDPPFSFVHATNDAVVPPQMSYALKVALTNAGVSARAHYFSSLGHVPNGENIDAIAYHFFMSAFGLDPEGLRTGLLVSCFNNDQVLEFNAANGRLMGTLVQGFWPAGAHGGLALPHQPRLAPDGSLLVADAGNDRILRYDARSGDYRGVFAAHAALDYPVDLAYGPDGLLYVSSQLNDQVVRFDATSGVFHSVFVTNVPSQLDGPSGLAFGPDGTLYVAGRFNNVVARYATNGVWLGPFITSGLNQPFGVRLGPDGALYVANGNNHEVRRHDASTGAYLGQAATTNLSLPIGLEFAPDGRMLVASYINNRINAFNPTNGNFFGTLVTTSNTILSGPNFFTFRPPFGVAQLVTTNVVLNEQGGSSTQLWMVREGGTLGTLTETAFASAPGDVTLTGLPLTWSHGHSNGQAFTVTAVIDTLAEGTETNILTARSSTNRAVVTVLDRPLEQWRRDHFGAQANAPEGQPEADYDGDGWANLMEYALGLNATGLTVGAEQKVGIDGNYLTLTTARDPAADDVVLEAESGDALTTWTNDVVVLTNTPSVFSARDAVPAHTAPQRFLRLHAIRP